ncbi:MAG: DUF5615 family PIN-like protein [Elusimicrobia bacterium]|nr:DUF5615 family PIN-like protein [Elusimicrobiota bacterium]
MISAAKLYLNENVAVRLVTLLKSRQIDAVHTLQVHPPGLSDLAQLEYAAYKGYVLLTHNRRHFRRLHNQWLHERKAHAGIVVVKHDSPERLADRLVRFLTDVYPSLTPPFCTSPPALDPQET